MQNSDSVFIDKLSILGKMGFWPEYSAVGYDFKFSPFGGATTEIPEFHRKNSKNLSENLSNLEFQYQFPSGKPELKKAFVEYFPEAKMFKESGIELDPLKNILIAGGAVPGICWTIEALVEAGDEIITFEPIYPYHYSKLLTKAGIKLKTQRLKLNKETNRFEIDYESLKNAISDKTKLILLINPQNPVARVFGKEEWMKLYDIVKEHPELVVLEDRAYFLYHADENKTCPFGSLSNEAFKQSITVYSGGKMYNTTGSRIGFCVMDQENYKRISLLSFIELTWASAFEQAVAVQDLKDAYEENFYETSRKDIIERVNKIKKGLEERVPNVKLMPYEGTYFLLIDVEGLRDKIEEMYFGMLGDQSQKLPELDKAVCRKLYLNSDKVGMFPLSCMYFGSNPPDNIVRISINRCDKDLDMFLDAFAKNFGG